MDSATISVVIPTYNRAHCIARALDSVLAQSVAPQEIIVVDDASRDDTASVLASYEGRIHYIRHARNAGASAARNTGIAAATSAWIAFLDSDDAWRPQKLERQLAFMAAHGTNVCCTNCDLIWPNGQVEPAYRPYPARMGIEHFVWGCFTCPGSTLIARHSLLQAVGGYDLRYPRHEDWDLFLRLTRQRDVSIGFLSEHLSVSWRDSRVDAQKVSLALETLKMDHLKIFASGDKMLKKKFLSAIAFSQAANMANQKMYFRAISNMLRAFVLHPMNNDPINIILMPYLKRRLGHYGGPGATGLLP